MNEISFLGKETLTDTVSTRAAGVLGGTCVKLFAGDRLDEQRRELH